MIDAGSFGRQIVIEAHLMHELMILSDFDSASPAPGEQRLTVASPRRGRSVQCGYAIPTCPEELC